MPNLKTEIFGGSDHSWLGSAHGIANARTETLDVATLTKATHYPEGVIPSGLPLGKSGNKVVLWDGTAPLVGFLFDARPTDGTTPIPVPVLDHGRIKTANLPVAFTAPAGDLDKTTCVYV